MSNFLFIIPEGWTQLDLGFISNNVAGLGLSDIRNGVVSDVEERLKIAGVIPQESSLQEFKLFNDEVLLVRLG
jgi:hypothetical protein